MHQADRQQNSQPPHQENEAARMAGQTVELNGKANAEQE